MQRIGARNRARSRAIAVALAAATVAAGCGDNPSTGVPVSCKKGPAAIRTALKRAPLDVRLGGVRLSSCFTRGSGQGDVQAVGLSFLPAVTALAAAARDHPGGPAAMRLGFLVGAVHRGGAGAQGIYSELVRRIDAELAGVDTNAPRFQAGRRAGRDHG